MQALFALGTTTLLLIGAWYLLQVIAYWRIFKKAGKPGWHSIIPILNTYDQYALSWKGFWGIVFLGLTFAVVMLSPNGTPAQGKEFLVGVLGFAAGVIDVIASHKLSKAFGHGILFTLGLIFLNPIFMLILGFGGSTYRGRQ